MPVITIAGLQLGSIIAFAIITETVFQWPGMGLLFIQAVQFADIPVMAAYLVLVALVFVVINLVVDLLYYVVDPRLRIGRERGVRLTARRHRAPPAADRSVVARGSLDSDLVWSFRHSPVAIARPRSRSCPGRSPRCSRPWLAPHDPFDLATLDLLDAFTPPAWLRGRRRRRFPLGTDDQGRDMLSAILFGARISLLVGLAVGRCWPCCVGVALGLVAGYAGGIVDAADHARRRRAAVASRRS